MFWMDSRFPANRPDETVCWIVLVVCGSGVCGVFRVISSYSTTSFVVFFGYKQVSVVSFTQRLPNQEITSIKSLHTSSSHSKFLPRVTTTSSTSLHYWTGWMDDDALTLLRDGNSPIQRFFSFCTTQVENFLCIQIRVL